MKIDPNSMLICGLNREVALQLQQAIEECVLNGVFTPVFKDIFEQWRLACGFDDTQGLLCMSTVFPQRAALSLVRYYSDEAGNLTPDGADSQALW